MSKKSRKAKKSPEALTGFSASIIKKQFRFSDWFAEKFIKSVAFLSIAFVILIFLFVFRETLPLFREGKSKSQISENANPSEYAPQSYSSDENAQSGNLVPETYSTGNEEDAKNTLVPETYSSENENSEPLKPEAYGDVKQEDTPAVSYSENDESVSALTGTENSRALGTLGSKDWQPVSDNPRYGLLPLILGTLKITILSILFAAPLAILAAIYTSMFASRRMREIIKPVIELLAGFPSVVIGFIALMVLASFFQGIFGYSSRLNAFVGGIAMGLAAIPVIFTLTEDALSAVPRTYIEASLGLGASIRQTAFSVILPAASPGIFAAVLLGIGRVFGETMIALMATGNAALISLNPFDSVRTLSATIGAEMAEVVFGDTHYSILFLIGSLLFIFTFALNAFAEFYFKKRLIARIQGK
jgi:phosphate transport system permease protein